MAYRLRKFIQLKSQEIANRLNGHPKKHSKNGRSQANTIKTNEEIDSSLVRNNKNRF